MFELDDNQKDAIGLTFLLNHLIADSPYGAEEIKKITPFTQDDISAVLECFDNIDKAISIENTTDMDTLRQLLMKFKNIRACVAKLDTAKLNEIELFELKDFLLNFEKFYHVFNKLNTITKFINIHFTNLTAALDILDIQKRRIIPFSLEDGFSEKLSHIREKKSRLELALRQEKDNAKREAMQAKRLEIVVEEDAEEEIVMTTLCQKLRPFTAGIATNMNNLGKLDLTLAKARHAIEFNAVRPKINPHQLILKNMSNPFVESILSQEGKSFTKISLNLDTGITIITGANMGGKSVAIKTTVLNIMLCRLGLFVTATEAEIPLFDGICISLSDGQSITGGLSTFGAEIKQLDAIVKNFCDKQLFLFIALDEFARGTNPQEGAIIVRAVARFLNNKNAISLMSTHFDGVVPPGSTHYQVAGLKPNIKKEDVSAISDLMDYRLVKTESNALVPKDALSICKLMELDSEIIAEIEKGFCNG